MHGCVTQLIKVTKLTRILNTFSLYLYNNYKYIISKRTYNTLRLKLLFICNFNEFRGKLTPLKRDTILRLYSTTRVWLLVTDQLSKYRLYGGDKFMRRSFTLHTAQELVGFKFGMYFITRTYNDYRSRLDKKKIAKLRKLIITRGKRLKKK